ncbi:MAG: hypothetical protein DWQ31_02480 [Planctomycetota bacterium]|nr:MAG: hypothetical protein DWQ31_02480 [Planctomycetota bacterium]REJ95792.1 MAG: hypothetical protein DWQ35_05930 [Planctomycetota bacterium]REK25367.1 MAG: hypothetical protein DWQ42_11625 [Planctomycetota bacterium]REK43502.1 MAG: hypothetical protein DWQ46_11370 [Planctomycetota bacterium]
MSEPLATHDFAEGGLTAALAFFKRTRNELRTLRKVRVSTTWVRLFDINGDFFELTGLGYGDAEVVPVLESFDTPLKRETIHDPVEAEYKEFLTGRRYAWAADRVM